jgi:predicted DNA-binding WGR domain protein
MIRFERVASNEFWEVALLSGELVERSGRVGAQGRERRSLQDDDRAARTQLRKRVLDKHKAGFRIAASPTLRPRLAGTDLETIASTRPNDSAVQEVYRDWLIGQGDPRGELLALTTKLEKSSGDAWFECWRQLETAFQTFTGGAQQAKAEWKDGALVSSELTLEADGPFADPTAAAFQKLQRLTVRSKLSLQPALDGIAAAGLPALRHLSLESEARQLGALGPLLSQVPLESLRLHGTDFSLGDEPVTVTALTVIPHRFLFSTAIAALQKTRFPELLSLSLVATEAEAVLGWLFSAKNMPALKTLRIELKYGRAEESLLTLLKKAPLLKQLHRLDLLGDFNYDMLKLLRAVGLTAHVEGAQFGRLRSLVRGLELIPHEAL